MSITTYQLTVDLLRPDGSAIANAPVTATLTKPDVSLTEGQVGKVTLEVTSSDNGSAVFSLWPNTKGTHGSQYRIKAIDPDTGAKLVDTTVTMPANDCHLRDIAMSPAPTPKPYDEASIAAIQQARIEAGNHKVDAETAATEAANSKQQATDKATEAASSATTASDAKEAVELLKGAVVESALQVATHKTSIEADRVAADQAKDALTATGLLKDEARSARDDSVAARDASQNAQAATEGLKNTAGTHAQTATNKAAEAEQSAADSAQVGQVVVNERVTVTEMRDECAQHNAITTQNKNASEAAAEAATTEAGTATQKAQEAKDAESTAAQHKADAEAARDSISGPLVQMATSHADTLTLILQQVTE